jgi:hypothetical protein
MLIDTLPPEIEAAHGALVAALAARADLTRRLTERPAEDPRPRRAAEADLASAERKMALADEKDRPAMARAVKRAIAAVAAIDERGEMLRREKRAIGGLLKEADVALVEAAAAWAAAAAPFRAAIKEAYHEHIIAAAEPLVRALRLGYAVASALPGLEIGAALDGVVVPRFRPPNGPLFTHIVNRGRLWTADDNHAGDDLRVTSDPATLALCALMEPLVAAEQTAAALAREITSSPSWGAERVRPEPKKPPLPPLTDNQKRHAAAYAAMFGDQGGWPEHWGRLAPSEPEPGRETDGRRP